MYSFGETSQSLVVPVQELCDDITGMLSEVSQFVNHAA